MENNCNSEDISESVCSFRYSVIAETGQNGNLGEYQTYGLLIETTDKSEVTAETLHDVTVNHDTACEIAALFETNQLFPVHLHNVLEDMNFDYENKNGRKTILKF